MKLKMSAIPKSEINWTMYGGNEKRNNVSFEIVIPPLDSVWEYDTEAGLGPTAAAGADSILFISNLRGEIHAINIKTGKNVGFFDFGSAIVGTPIIDGDMLFVAIANEGEGLAAYHLKTASIKWRCPIGDIESSPLLLGNRLYATTLDGKLMCIEKENGNLLWTYEIPGNKKTKHIHSSPASDGKVITFGCYNGSLYTIDAMDGRLCWNVKTRGSVFSSPSIQEGKVFIGSTDSTLYSFDISTGDQLWSQQLNGKIYSSQAVVDNHVYVGTINKTMYCLNSDNGNIVWQTNLDGLIKSPPIVSGSIIYIGDLSKMFYALDSSTGKILWQHKVSGRIKTAPVIFQKHIFLFNEDRSVVAFMEKFSR